MAQALTPPFLVAAFVLCVAGVAKLGLIDWLRIHGPEEPFLLIRTALYDRMAPDLAGLATPLYQEDGLKRNTLTLLQVHDDHRLTAAPRP